MALSDPFETTARLMYEAGSQWGKQGTGVADMIVNTLQQKQQRQQQIQNQQIMFKQKRDLMNQQSMDKLKSDVYTGISKGDIEPTDETGEDTFKFPGMENLGRFKIKKGTQAAQQLAAMKFQAMTKLQKVGSLDDPSITDADKVILGQYPKKLDIQTQEMKQKEEMRKDVDTQTKIRKMHPFLSALGIKSDEEKSFMGDQSQKSSTKSSKYKAGDTKVINGVNYKRNEDGQWLPQS